MTKESRSDTIPTIPADGVEFELTLESSPDPLEMVGSDGYDPRAWVFTGKNVAPQTKRFKLVHVGNCYDLGEVRKKLAEHGSSPEGQWREAFKKAFPRNDSQGPIGFADPSWMHPLEDDARFPALRGFSPTWHSYFDWAECNLDEYWRWLVEVNR